MDMKTQPSTPERIDELRIDGPRLWDSLMTLATIGATPKGGVCRLTLTDLDKQGRDLVLGWAREAGLEITIDRIGNGFMRRPGRNHLLPPIVTGSHIDTQPTGGKFDGNYGVLAGIEVVRTLNDHGIQTEAPIEVAFWTNEEGSRFVPVMMGSGVFAKAFTLETRLCRERHRRQDREGRVGTHRLHRHAGARRSPDRRLLRNAHRAGTGARRQRQDDRRGRRRARHPLVRLRRQRHGSACRGRRRWRCARTRCKSPPS